MYFIYAFIVTIMYFYIVLLVVIMVNKFIINHHQEPELEPYCADKSCTNKSKRYKLNSMKTLSCAAETP